MTKRKAITLGILSTALISLIAIGLTYNKKDTTIETKAENTIIDLSNTKWIFNDRTINNPYDQQTYNITFTTTIENQEKTYNQIKIGRDTVFDFYGIIYYNSTYGQGSRVYDINQGIQTNNGWLYESAKTISISGGNDSENATLITYITQNATQVTPTPPEPDPTPDVEDGNFVSIQELMLNILTMPFTFIAQAFNVTLWPNTPYSLNISNFILGIIAIASVLFIIKLFTSGFNAIGNYTANQDNREFKRSQTRLNNARTQQIQENKPKVTHTYIHKDK